MTTDTVEVVGHGTLRFQLPDQERVAIGVLYSELSAWHVKGVAY
jgi:hypothetical protein